MKLLRKWFSFVWLMYALTVFFMVMLLVLPFIVGAYALLGRYVGGKVAHRFLQLWAYSFICFGIYFRVKGKEHLCKQSTPVFISNHSSYLDAPALYAAISRPFYTLGKAELSKVPIFKFIYKRVVILVDRSSALSRAQSMHIMCQMLHDGFPIAIFPEGTMNRSRQILQPFQPGAFKLAVMAKAPIQPLIIHNSGKLLPPGQYLKLRPGVVTIEFLEPLFPTNFETYEALMQAAQQSMNAALKSYMCRQ